MAIKSDQIVDEVLVDDEEFCMEFMSELEQSFGITFPRDLTHIHTAGDLFDEIMGLRPAPGTGDRCDTAMAFFLLRRALLGDNPNSRIGPQAQLSALTDERPKLLRERLARETGLEMPMLTISTNGCILALAMFVVAAGLAILEFYWGAAVTVAVLAVILRFDRGQWAGSWKILGDLARATARRNVMRLSTRGARSRQQDWWRAFVAILADTTYMMHGKERVTAANIGPETRFRFT